MRVGPGLCAALLLLSACGGDDTTNAGPLVGDGAVPSSNNDGSLADAFVLGSDDSGSASARDASVTESDADMPPLVLEIPKAIVDCNGTSCDTLNNVCCESWSMGKGFGSTRECLTLAQCNSKYSRSGQQNRAVSHECDGKEDCSGGQVCCFFGSGQPLCETVDILMCNAKPIGPGGSRICTDVDNCVVGIPKFVAEGVPYGIYSCNDDEDCADKPGTSCKPEEANSASTGKNTPARSYVSVCR